MSPAPTGYADLREPTPLIDPVPPRRGSRGLRSLGYLAATVLWAALTAVAVFAVLFALEGGLQSVSADGGLQNAPLFDRSDGVVGAVVISLIVILLLGPATIILLCATLGMLLSCAILVARSLSPEYAAEQLAFSTRSRGETVGGPMTAFVGVTQSFLPIRLTRWSKIVAILRFNGWVINPNQFVLGPVWGALYLWTVGWLLWPARGVGVPVCIGISVLLLAVFIGLVWRRRGRYAEVMPERFERTVYARSWPNARSPRARPRRR